MLDLRRDGAGEQEEETKEEEFVPQMSGEEADRIAQLQRVVKELKYSLKDLQMQLVCIRYCHHCSRSDTDAFATVLPPCRVQAESKEQAESQEAACVKLKAYGDGLQEDLVNNRALTEKTREDNEQDNLDLRILNKQSSAIQVNRRTVAALPVTGAPSL